MSSRDHHLPCPCGRELADECMCPRGLTWPPGGMSVEEPIGSSEPVRWPACGCPPNEFGDIRCHNCGEYVNKRCWNCGTPRGEGPCPNPEGRAW